MGKPEEEHESEGPEASAVEDQAKTSRMGGRKQQLPDSECQAGISAVSHRVSGLSFARAGSAHNADSVRAVCHIGAEGGGYRSAWLCAGRPSLARTSWLTPGSWREGWLDQTSRLCSSWRQARYCAARCKPLVFPDFSQVPAPIISVKLAQRIVWCGGYPADGRQLSQ